MSIEHVGQVLKMNDPRMTPAMRLLAIGIANHDGDGGAFPKVATLAKYVGVSERHVQNLIAQMQEIGRLSVENQGGGSRDLPEHLRPNRYSLNYLPGEPQFTPPVNPSSPHRVNPSSPLNHPIEPKLEPVISSPVAPGEVGSLELSLDFEKKPKVRKSKPTKLAADPRHHEITSQIKTRFQNATGRDYHSNFGLDATRLKAFLKSWPGTAEEFFRTAQTAWKEEKNPYAGVLLKASSLAGLCQFWPEICAKLQGVNGIRPGFSRPETLVDHSAIDPRLGF